MNDDSEKLGYLDEEAINALIHVFAPVLSHGEGMRAREHEAGAREALRAFLRRARVGQSGDPQ